MSKLIRHYSPGQTYFVTSVTYNRQKILVEYKDFFCHAVDKVRIDSPFEIVAWVIIPDHFHLIIDPLESNLSSIIKRIKLSFAYQFRNSQNMYRSKVWQSRFWDHIIRDENDLNKHLDYIHYNPVKHGLVSSPFDWEPSSIHGFLKRGQYEPDWGTHKAPVFKGEFGE
jgi:putative transposase